ncbi:STAS domain-containing protein [Streptomyces sp. ISL-44]|uniref:STAS domain-containing protein n=1 Tax=Streptomyces sp. ISL-44 TaxID=2819184 RepID=UPI001BE8B484|nr:STAS domain-containing protein [Streptomyces sp. ISL-44]MBT2544850.1 STAS domain-containing protein [Streptomyces sp. ISL-44]
MIENAVPLATGALPPQDFACLVRIEGSKLLLAPSGDIDFAALPTLTAARCLIGHGVSAVDIDLSSVPFMDSSGINFIASLQDVCERRGIALQIVGLRPQPRQLLAFIGDRLLTLCERGSSQQLHRWATRLIAVAAAA